MPLGVQASLTCDKVQTRLNQFYANNLLKTGTYKENAALMFLKSPQNRAGVEQIQDYAQDRRTGRKKTVRMVTKDPICLEIVKKNWGCDDVTQKWMHGEKEHIFTLDNGEYVFYDKVNDNTLKKPLVLEWDWLQYRDSCQREGWFEETITDVLRRIDDVANTELLTQLASKLGKQIDETSGAEVASVDVPLFYALSGSPAPQHNHEAEYQIALQYRLAKRQAAYAVMGGNTYDRYMNNRGLSSVNMYGFDPAKNGKTPFYYDMEFEGIFGAKNFISLPYGGVQLVQWSNNVGDYVVDMPDSKHFTVKTPAGLDVDVYWEHNTKNHCNKITIGFSWHMELVAVPGGGCGFSNDINGIFKFHDCSTVGKVAC